MSRLHMVRHGQAMFLTDDYDRLSPLGVTQAGRVGEALAVEGVPAPSFIAGTLRRQRDTLTALSDASGYRPGEPFDADPAFDEFPFEPMLRRQVERLSGRSAEFDAALAANEAATDRRDRVKAVQRLLELAIDDWVDSGLSDADAGLPCWADFCARAVAGVERLQQRAARGSHVVIVSSGGVIAAVTQHALGVSPAVASKLCWRINNASLTQFTFDSRRLSLDHFNRVGHLPAVERTYR